jgi:hypothetical protein
MKWTGLPAWLFDFFECRWSLDYRIEYCGGGLCEECEFRMGDDIDDR